jgi:hypothetical protein
MTAAEGITNLTLGIVLVAGLGLLAGLPAMVLGCLALSRSHKSPGQYGGPGLAAAGRALGCGSVLITLWLVGVVIPGFASARALAQKQACIIMLGHIDAAKDQWGLENKKTAREPVVVAEVDALLKNIQNVRHRALDGSVVSLPDPITYFKNGEHPVCPAGGTYSYNVICEKPTCSLGAALGHTL